jgi:hypothetical protein
MTTALAGSLASNRGPTTVHCAIVIIIIITIIMMIIIIIHLDNPIIIYLDAKYPSSNLYGTF